MTVQGLNSCDSTVVVLNLEDDTMARSYLLNDTYNEVTDRIVAALEQGVAPWVCPWRRDSGGDGGRPHNGASYPLGQPHPAVR